jgi:DNA-binding response OmpR family regulator
VLVVDDDDSVRSSIADILRTAGLSTEEAADGIFAMRVLAQRSVGAMVLDLRMPRYDGFEVLGALEDPPPVVVISATFPSADERRRWSDKVAAFLSKPVPPQLLLAAVSAALGHSAGS